MGHRWADYEGKEVGVFWRSTREAYACSGKVLGVDESGIFLDARNEDKGMRGELFIPWLSISYISLTTKDELARRLLEGS